MEASDRERVMDTIDDVNVVCDKNMTTMTGCTTCMKFEPFEFTVNRCGDCKYHNPMSGICLARRAQRVMPFGVDAGGEACDWFEPKPVPVTIDEIRENVFEKAVRDYCTKVADTIIEKNRKYGDSFRAVRQECKERYGDTTIPLFIHTFEKERRLKNQDNDDEDAAFDRIGYLTLEEICKELDD